MFIFYIYKNLHRYVISLAALYSYIRLQKYILIFREPDNELVPENQEEIATTSRSDKRSRADEELFEDANATSHKRPKIIAMQVSEIVRNGTNIELTEKDKNMDINKSQADDESSKETEVKETENTLQEQNKIQNKEQSQLDIDMIPNVVTESKMECELAASLNINTEKQKQHEKPEAFTSCTDEKDERVEKSPKINEEVQKSQNDSNVWEALDDDVIDSLNLFHDEVKLND